MWLPLPLPLRVDPPSCAFVLLLPFPRCVFSKIVILGLGDGFYSLYKLPLVRGSYRRFFSGVLVVLYMAP